MNLNERLTSPGEQLNTKDLGALLTIIIAAALVRWPLLTATVPRGDGGMFAQMISEIRAHGFALPYYTAYNQLSIPFVYPPLGFYLVLALSALLHEPTLRLMASLPTILTILALVPTYLLTRQCRFSSLAAILACAPLCFACPELLFMGGGVTRALSFLTCSTYALLAHRVLLTQHNGAGPIAGVVAGLALLSHPEAPMFVAFITLVFSSAALARGGLAVIFPTLAVMSFFAALTAGAWALTVLTRHGLTPWAQAFSIGGGLGFASAAEYIVRLKVLANPAFSAFGLLGLSAAILTRRFWLVVWFIGTCLLLARSLPTYALIPGSLLMALAYEEVVLPRLRGAHKYIRVTCAALLLVGAVLLGLQYYSTIERSEYRYFDRVTGPNLQLSPAWFQAYAWLQKNSSPLERFVVISDWSAHTLWFSDWPSEWFAFYTQKRVDNVAQGLEWQNAKLFSRLSYFYEKFILPFKHCKFQAPLIGRAWLTRTLVLQRPLGKIGRRLIRSNRCSRYRLVYRNQGLAIYRPEAK